jgi:outer membrane protein assembly complex protein YaeT
VKLWLIFLLLLLPLSRAAVAASALEEAQDFRGQTVEDVQFQGDSIDAQAKSRFEGLRGRKFSPTELRALLLWFHEHGSDSLIQLSVEDTRGGVRLIVNTREKKRIVEVQFTGNNTVPGNTLLPILSVKEGGEFEKESADDSVQKIILFYSKQGYLATDVTYSFVPEKGILVFNVTEGEPTLLSGLEITPLASIERKDLRARYERELKEAFGLQAGDRIQRDRVIDGVQAVKDWLRDHDFLMARDPALEYKVDETGGVAISVNIQYGPRIRYGFRGNHQFSYRELMILVGEVKEVSSGSDYLTAVRRRVLEAYREIGFANAQISTLVREDPSRGIRYVSLIVEEGAKIQVSQVNIEGIYSMSKDDAVKKFKSLSSRLVQRDFFDEAGINSGAELLAEFLRSQGYLSAKLEFVKFDFNDDRSKVSVSLLFSEGIQTKVQEVKLTGVRSFTEGDILGFLSLRKGEPFNIFAFERGLVSLKEHYQALGNLSVQFLNEGSDDIVRYSRDNSEVFIHLEVDEGPVYRVGEVVVRGNQQTHARVVLRELPFITNDILTTPLLAEAEENIRKLNLFSDVIVRPIDKPGYEDVKDILIFVEETTPGSFDIVPGYRNDLGLRLGFELGYNNLGGWNRSINARAVFNRRTEDYKYPEYNFSIGFREPYLANWPVVFTTNLTLFKRQFPSFDADVNRLTVGIKRDLTPTLSGILEYSFEKYKISNVQKPYEPDDARTDFIGSITPGFVVDSRNDRFNPSSGVNSINRFEVASQFFGSEAEVGYYRFTTFNSTYFRLFDDLVLALGMNVGWERSNVQGKQIPIFKLFRLGGLGSIRGMAEDSLQVETEKNINGILGFVNYRAELRIPLIGNVGTALFLDAGNLMVDRFTLSPSQLRSSVGTGLRYNTPVGPVVLDFAWRLQTADKVGDTRVEDAGSDRFRIHFSIGAF